MSSADLPLPLPPLCFVLQQATSPRADVLRQEDVSSVDKVRQPLGHHQFECFGVEALAADEAVRLGKGVVILLRFLEDNGSGIWPRQGQTAKRGTSHSWRSGQQSWKTTLGMSLGPAAGWGAEKSADLTSPSCSSCHGNISGGGGRDGGGGGGEERVNDEAAGLSGGEGNPASEVCRAGFLLWGVAGEGALPDGSCTHQMRD